MDKFEKYLKKNIKKSPDYEPDPTLKERVFYNANLVNKPKQSFFKRNIIKLTSSFACLVLLCAVVSIIVVSNMNKTKPYLAIVEIDVNPKIEMIVNQEKEVTSIKGLNDEGKMIIVDEELVGKNLDEVLLKILDIEMKTGFLNYDLTAKEIGVMVTAEDDKIVKKIKENIDNSITTLNDKENSNLVLYYKEGKTLEDVKNYVSMTNPTLSSDTINNMKYNDLIENIVVYHKEISDLGSVELENMYLEIKKQSVAKKLEDSYYERVNKLDSSYSLQIKEYNEAYDLWNEVYNTYQDMYVDLFINPNSKYQKALKGIADKKEEIIKQKKIIAEMKRNGESVVIAEIILKTIETQYEIIEESLKTAKEEADDLFTSVITELENISEKISKLKLQFSEMINEISIDDLLNNESIQSFINEIKSNFVEKYESIIENVNNEIKNKKENLMMLDK